MNQNLIVKIPLPASNQPSTISYLDWTGIGYIKENLSTGEAGYMLSGMIAGSYTVHMPEDWKNQDLVQTLKTPFQAALTAAYVMSL